MTMYELTNRGYEAVDYYIPQIDFCEDSVFSSTKNGIYLKLEYELENMPFDINRASFLILLQDIHNNTPCGTLLISVPIGEETNDIILYTIRFSREEFDKIKKIYLTNFPK